MKFFLDNCLSYKFARMLSALGLAEVTSLRDHYPEDMPDEAWLADLGKNSWTLITVDHNQRRKPEETAALRQSGAVAFYIAKPFLRLDFATQAWNLVKFWPDIIGATSSRTGGRCYMVRINGKIEIIPP